MSKVYMVRKNRNWAGIIALFAPLVMVILLIIYRLQSLRLHQEPWNFDLLFGTQLFVILSYLIYISVAIFRALSKPFELEVGDDYLRVKSRQVSKDDIGRIRVQGYWNPIIGIELKGKKVIPMDLCFQFNNNEDEVMPVIRRWCEAHQIPVVRKNIVRLI